MSARHRQGVARIVVLAMGVLVPSAASAQQPAVVLTDTVAAGPPAAKPLPDFVANNRDAKLWRLSLAFDEPPADARLEVFKGDPEAAGLAVCRASGAPQPDSCLVEGPVAVQGGLWVRVSANIQPGRGPLPYRITARPLNGTQLAGTELFTDDAAATLAAGTNQPGVLRDARAPTEHVYKFSGRARDLIVVNIDRVNTGLLALTLHDAGGRMISGSYTLSPDQVLLVPADASGGYVVVRGQSTVADSEPGVRPGYTLSLVSGNGDSSAAVESQLASGYAFRYAMSGNVYRELNLLGNQQAAARGRLEAASTAMTFLAGLIGPSVSTGRTDPDEQQPVVVFVGLGGQSTIVQLRRKRGGLYDPGVETLGRARQFWAVYIEDDQSSFETSVDVQFSERAPQVDFEGFNPLSGSRTLSNSAKEADQPRMVRIGLRRFRMRPPPVAVQVAFTRQGPTYGLRQWQRVFRVVGFGPLGFALGVFIPATEISVARHEVVERDCQVTIVVCQRGEEALINQRFFRRQVFATAMIQWYGARSRFIDATNRWEKTKALWPPNLIVGIGLPPTFDNVGYAGVSWPLAWNRLQATIGSTFSKPERRVPQYRVGQRVPLDTPRESLFTKDDWRFKATFGVSIDLFRER